MHLVSSVILISPYSLSKTISTISLPHSTRMWYLCNISPLGYHGSAVNRTLKIYQTLKAMNYF